MNHLISESLTSALGWTIVHSLWQGAAIALLAVTLSKLWPGGGIKNPKNRYALYATAMMAMFLVSLATFSVLYEPTNAVTDYPLPHTSDSHVLYAEAEQYAVFVVPTESSTIDKIWSAVENYLPSVVQIWAIGMFILALKLLGGWIYLRRLRTRADSIVSKHWQQKTSSLAAKMGIRQNVSLSISAHVSTPLVIGYLKPMILLPIGTLNALSPKEVEAILAHELAHVFRHDYLINIFQSVMEVLFYYHPATWWLSGRVRHERELCCDDLAVKACGGDRLAYAKSLLRLQEWVSTSSAPALALALGNRKQLLARVQSILNINQQKNRTQMEKLWIMIALAMVTAAFLPDAQATLDDAENVEIWAAQDTSVPKAKSIQRSVYENNENGVETKIVKENGKITSLKMNGKVIAEKDYPKYKEKVDELMNSVPEPPAPPAPPAVEDLPAPPAPPGFTKTITIDEDGTETISIRINKGDVKTIVREYVNDNGSQFSINKGDGTMKITIDSDGEELIELQKYLRKSGDQTDPNFPATFYFDELDFEIDSVLEWYDGEERLIVRPEFKFREGDLPQVIQLKKMKRNASNAKLSKEEGEKLRERLEIELREVRKAVELSKEAGEKLRFYHEIELNDELEVEEKGGNKKLRKRMKEQKEQMEKQRKLIEAQRREIERQQRALQKMQGGGESYNFELNLDSLKHNDGYFRTFPQINYPLLPKHVKDPVMKSAYFYPSHASPFESFYIHVTTPEGKGKLVKSTFEDPVPLQLEIGKMLAEDKLIKEGQRFNFKLQDRQMEVNGKTVPYEYYKKYNAKICELLGIKSNLHMNIMLKKGSKTVVYTFKPKEK